jgi:hypothetical protein
MTFLFLKLSKVKIFPNAVHTKNVSYKGASTLQIFFQGNGESTGNGQHMVKRLDFKLLPLRGNPTYLSSIAAI